MYIHVYLVSLYLLVLVAALVLLGVNPAPPSVVQLTTAIAGALTPPGHSVTGVSFRQDTAGPICSSPCIMI